MERVLRSGNLLPTLSNQHLHLERLKDRDFNQSEAHCDLMRFEADWRIAHENVCLFANEVVSQASLADVPLYCCEAVYGSCDIVHAQYGDLLGEKDWHVLAHFGYMASKRLGITVKNMSPHRPSRWYVSVSQQDVGYGMNQALKRKLINESIDEYINGNAISIL